jgi:glycosyltransferase involved in cell wall biosynthesis
VRILVDYRPALRKRTGVGEYIHELTRAYTAVHDDDVAIFSSSWRDRLPLDVGPALGVTTVDQRIPVRILNLLWHRAEWPPIELLLADRVDVVHAAHPLLIPARHAAQIVTIHDLFFLSQADNGSAEIRRDYAALAADHARRAHAVVTSTEHGRQLIVKQLGVPPSHVHVCRPGAPEWENLGRTPHRPDNGYVLFVGTLERRKNIGVLLDAYTRLLAHGGPTPRLVLAGLPTPDATEWLARMSTPPLRGHVEHLGYVTDRERVYAGARVLVLPSLDEGFGLPVLEAMSAGIPVVAADRGALPEVVGEAGCLVDPTDVVAVADAIQRALADDEWADGLARAGLARAATFTWPAAAHHLNNAYRDAIDRRHRHGNTAHC